jgi:hypothetical protein
LTRVIASTFLKLSFTVAPSFSAICSEDYGGEAGRARYLGLKNAVGPKNQKIDQKLLYPPPPFISRRRARARLAVFAESILETGPPTPFCISRLLGIN